MPILTGPGGEIRFHAAVVSVCTCCIKNTELSDIFPDITGNLIKVLVHYNLCAAIICCGIKHFKLIPCELFFHMPDNLFQQAAVIYLPQFSDEFHLVCRFVHV